MALTPAACVEHLVRYVCRPVIAAKRLEAVGDHKVRITFKNKWKGGISGVTLTKRAIGAARDSYVRAGRATEKCRNTTQFSRSPGA